MLAKFERRGCATLAFTHDHARIANEAEPLYGSGNGNGGPLNLLDLMVYAVARERGEPLLCTRKDFPVPDIALHKARRPWLKWTKQPECARGQRLTHGEVNGRTSRSREDHQAGTTLCTNLGRSAIARSGNTRVGGIAPSTQH